MNSREIAQHILDGIVDDDLYRRVSRLSPDPELAVEIALESEPEFRAIYKIAMTNLTRKNPRRRRRR